MSVFEDYLTSPDTYQRLEDKFSDIFSEEAAKCGLEESSFKCPYYTGHLAHGNLFKDGNPIFSASHRLTGNIIRIVVSEEAGDYSIIENKDDDNVELCLIVKLAHVERTRREICYWIQSQGAK